MSPATLLWKELKRMLTIKDGWQEGPSQPSQLTVWLSLEDHWTKGEPSRSRRLHPQSQAGTLLCFAAGISYKRVPAFVRRKIR